MKKIVEYKNGKVLINGKAKIKDKALRKQDHDAINTFRQKENYDPDVPHHKVTVIRT